MDTLFNALRDTNKVELCATQFVTTEPKDMDQFVGDLAQRALSNVELSA